MKTMSLSNKTTKKNIFLEKLMLKTIKQSVEGSFFTSCLIGL